MMSEFCVLARRVGLYLAVAACAALLRSEPPPARVAAAPRWTSPALQLVVDDMKARLAIPHAVTASIVPSNPRAVSVAPAPRTGGAFQIAIDGGFLALLTEDELSAAVAHELGHVWVSTHHPYLQTEGLANQIAMRVVSRGSLERLYAKAWAREGTKGDLQSFLGS
jgi:Zn-dependent protease with chaperone function